MSAQPFFWSSFKEKKDAFAKIKDQSLNLVIHGATGSGRSLLIDLIYHSLREKCEVRCISTSTLISLFKESESWLEESARCFDTIILDDLDDLFFDSEHTTSRFHHYLKRFLVHRKRLIISISTSRLKSVYHFLPEAAFERIDLHGVNRSVLMKMFHYELRSSPVKFSEKEQEQILEKNYADYHEFRSALSIAIFEKQMSR